MSCSGDKCKFKYYNIYLKELKIAVNPAHGCAKNSKVQEEIEKAIIDQVKIDLDLPDYPKEFLPPVCPPPTPPAPKACDCIPSKNQKLDWSPWSPYSLSKAVDVTIGKASGSTTPCVYTATGTYYLSFVIIEGTCGPKPDSDNWKPPKNPKTPEDDKNQGLGTTDDKKQVVPPQKTKK
jgi:hypothetical protein